MPYEVFERINVRVNTPALSIAPRGTIVFNAAAYRVLLKTGIRNVVILRDRSANKMAVKAAPKTDKNAFAITFTGGTHSASFRAKSFTTRLGWNAPKRQLLATSRNESRKDV